MSLQVIHNGLSIAYPYFNIDFVQIQWEHIDYMRQNAVIASIIDMLLQAQCIEHTFLKQKFFLVVKKKSSNKRKPNENQEALSTCGCIAAEATEVSF